MKFSPKALMVPLSAALGCTAPEKPPQANELSFEDAVEITPARTENSVAVQLRIKRGFHLYTTGETIGKPIEIEIDSEAGWVAKKAHYPKGQTIETSLGSSVVLTGDAEAKVEVAPKGDAPGPISGRFKYQVCTEKACDRPRSLDFKL